MSAIVLVLVRVMKSAEKRKAPKVKRSCYVHYHWAQPKSLGSGELYHWAQPCLWGLGNFIAYVCVCVPLFFSPLNQVLKTTNTTHTTNRSVQNRSVKTHQLPPALATPAQCPPLFITGHSPSLKGSGETLLRVYVCVSRFFLVHLIKF